jgi:hypothetical protein
VNCSSLLFQEYFKAVPLAGQYYLRDYHRARRLRRYRGTPCLIC